MRAMPMDGGLSGEPGIAGVRAKPRHLCANPIEHRRDAGSAARLFSSVRILAQIVEFLARTMQKGVERARPRPRLAASANRLPARRGCDVACDRKDSSRPG